MIDVQLRATVLSSIVDRDMLLTFVLGKVFQRLIEPNGR